MFGMPAMTRFPSLGARMRESSSAMTRCSLASWILLVAIAVNIVLAAPASASGAPIAMLSPSGSPPARASALSPWRVRVVPSFFPAFDPGVEPAQPPWPEA